MRVGNGTLCWKQIDYSVQLSEHIPVITMMTETTLSSTHVYRKLPKNSAVKYFSTEIQCNTCTCDTVANGLY